MERRLILAIALALLVWFLPMLIWPPKPAARRPGGPGGPTAGDTARVLMDSSRAADSVRPSGRPAVRPSQPTDGGRVVWVPSPLYRLGLLRHGGRPVSSQPPQQSMRATAPRARPAAPLARRAALR